ncbi:MAG: HAMP domain-containing sensor histidine kinase [Actinomycetota bacterium]
MGIAVAQFLLSQKEARQAQELEDARIEAEAANQAKSDFLAKMTHELRTPLTSVRTNLAVLRRHTDLPDDTRAEIVNELTAEVDELAVLVDDLVVAAQGDQPDESARRLDLTEVTRSVAERVGRRRDRHVDVSAPGELHVVAPANGIARAVTNLIDNAAKFDTTDGPVDVTITVGSAPGRDSSDRGDSSTWVRLRVGDRGPGVDDADLGRIFDRFHRAESARTLPGSGLGLSIVRDVVERAGGVVHAGQRPGGGAEIGFDLPAAPPD